MNLFFITPSKSSNHIFAPHVMPVSIAILCELSHGVKTQFPLGKLV